MQNNLCLKQKSATKCGRVPAASDVCSGLRPRSGMAARQKERWKLRPGIRVFRVQKRNRQRAQTPSRRLRLRPPCDSQSGLLGPRPCRRHRRRGEQEPLRDQLIAQLSASREGSPRVTKAAENTFVSPLCPRTRPGFVPARKRHASIEGFQRLLADCSSWESIS